MLAHFDPSRPLWIDLDASREWGFGVQIFHVKKDFTGDQKWPPRTAIEPIMFLSHMLTAAEKNYWPTELEIAGFVWTIKKVRHLVESSTHPVIVQTDHSAILDIMKQSSITSTTSTLRMNVRLVRASQFLRQFQLNVRHKPGKDHIVPDALSRLASATTTGLAEDYSELDALYGYTTQAMDPKDDLYAYSASIVSMDEAFRSSLLAGYVSDPYWSRIITMIDVGEGTDFSFVRGTAADKGLIFHKNKFTGIERLCIPRPVIKQVLEIAHGDGHPGFERCFQTVAKSWYIHGLSKHLRDYIRHCPDCLLLQTRRHRPYGSLQPIESPSVPFETLTLDFILAMPLSDEGFDCAMTVTDKFTKRCTFIAGKATWTAGEWAAALLDRLAIGDWGVPKVLLSDRDPKFLSELWKAIFERLQVKLLYSTAYHPQTDGISERTNQTAEIALRFYIHTLLKPSAWPTVLPRLQALLNNLQSSTTSKTPNEIAYGFKINKPLDLLGTTSLPQQAQARVKAADAISFAQIQQKYHYDRRHQPMYFKVGEKVLLRLHKGYSIPQPAGMTKEAKLSQQYVGPFDIVAKVGKQAYRLDIPDHWRVHPVFSVAQLEPWPNDSDPFDRPQPEEPDSIFVEGDTPKWKSFELERILNKRTHPSGKIEYLVKWKGYGPQHDRWYNVKRLENARELIQDYESTSQTVDSSQAVDSTSIPLLREAPHDLPETAPPRLRERAIAIVIPSMPTSATALPSSKPLLQIEPSKPSTTQATNETKVP